MLVREGYEENLLDISILEAGQEYNRIAYLMDFKSGQARNEQGFYTFYFKDVQSNVVVGRLFNIENFIESGLTASALVRKPVAINFLVQEYNGSNTLIIKNMEGYAKPFDYTKFIGEIPNADKSLEFVRTVFDRLVEEEITIPSEYSRITLSRVAGGKCGGYAKLLEILCQRLVSYKGITGVNIKILASILYSVQSLYYRHLQRLDTLDLIHTTDLVKFISECYTVTSNNEYQKIIVDTMSALLGLGKPEHLYANILYKEIKDCIRTLSLCEQYNAMIIGARKEVGELVLVKY